MLALDSFKKHIHTKYCTQLDRPAARNMKAAEQKLGPSFKQTNKTKNKAGVTVKFTANFNLTGVIIDFHLL